MLRKLLVLAVSMLAVAVVAFLALPRERAYACLPCDCPTFTSVNCYGDYALYTHVEKNDTCTIEVLGIHPRTGKPRPALNVTEREWSKIPTNPETNTLIDSYYEFSLYRLTSGEFQLNVGPDAENKVFVIIWEGCPASNRRESTFIAEEQG